MRVYVSVRVLPDECRPAHVVRDEGDVLLMVDPRYDRTELTLFCLDNMSQAERDHCTVAYGQVPGDIDPAFFEGSCLQWVPEPLRLPWEPAWQGELISA